MRRAIFETLAVVAFLTACAVLFVVLRTHVPAPAEVPPVPAARVTLSEA